MTHRALRLSCVALLLMLPRLPLTAAIANGTLASPQDGADEVSLRSLIERYFAAYASKDLDALERLWSDKSPDLAATKVLLKEFFSRNSHIETRNLDVRQLKIEGDRATALAKVAMSTIDAKTGKSTTGSGAGNREMTFVKESGTWRVWSDKSLEEGLAARLVAAKSDEERKTILDAQQEFVNLALCTALIRQGVAFRIKGKFSQALSTFELAQRLAAQINDQEVVAETWLEIAFLTLIQGNPTLALDRYQKAQTLCESLGAQGCLAGALTGIGNAQRFKGNADLGIDYLKKGLALSEQAGDQVRMAAALNSLGAAFDSQNKYVEAVNYYQRGLSVYESLGEKARAAILMSNAGASYNSLGEFDLAIEYLQKSIVVNEALGDENSLAGAFNNIGTSYSLKGDYSSAMRYFQKGLAIFEAQHDQRSEARNLVNLANVHRAQGNLSLALEYLQKSLALGESQQSGDTAGTLNNIGIVLTDQGDYPRALETYARAMSLAEASKDKSRIARVLTNLGVLYRFQGDYGLALASFQKSVALREELHEKVGVANSLSSMATVYELQGDHTRAAEYAERAIGLARETGSRVVLSDSLTKAGIAYRALGQTAKASESLREAISIIEALRADAGGGEQEQQQAFEQKISPYYSMVELLVAQGAAGEALTYAERSKSRVLLDVLRGGKVSVTKAMTMAEKVQEQNLRDALASLNSQLARENRRPQPDQARLTQLKTELEKARLDRQDFQSRLYAAHPGLQIQRGEAAWFKPEYAAALGVDSSAALLEYVVTADQTYLFVLTRATKGAAEVKVYPIALKRAELAKQVESFREKLAARNLLIREPARQMFDLLLKPAREQLRGKSNLIIVPDDVLWELPFQALLNESNHYLIEQGAISYAPSLTVLREMTAQRKERATVNDSRSVLLALGNPTLGQETIERERINRRDEKLEPLPEAEREVQTIALLYGPSRSEVFIGSEAGEARAKAEAGKFRVLHFATHGVVNNASPMYSHLLLKGDGKEDGLLEAWELLNLDLQADLVVLSACETARGRVGAGEGMIGLSWALFVAGTPTTVVSQWKVDSASTTALMLDFHRNRLAANSKSQSLRQAMLKMLGSNQYKHPFYWAPFVVIGDPN